jgi:integrase
MPKLTKPFCDTVKPPAKGYEIHWDDKVSGYGLRVTASEVKAFVAQGRVKGKAVIITIGRFGLFTEEQARKRAQSLLQQMRDGIDPRDVKRQDEAMSITLRLVADAYLSRPGMLKASTRAEMDRHIEQVFAKWKDRPIASLTPAECRKRFEEMATKGLRGKGPAPVQATIAFTTLRTLCRWAGDEYRKRDGSSIITVNPVATLKADLKKHAGKPRDRRIETAQVGMFWNWLQDARGRAQDAVARAGVDLVAYLALTGARKMEGAALEWRNVNLDEGWWHIEDPKNGNAVWLPLATQAVELLKERRKETTGEYVFNSRSKTGHIGDPRAALERFGKVIGMDRLSCHDLRRTWIDLGASACGLDIIKVELLTNHMPQGVTQKHYLKTGDLRAYRREVQAIADFIEQQAPIAAGANVVALRA